MKTLSTIQKTVNVFRILTKIAYIFSIVGASFCAVGALCSITWLNGGTVVALFGEQVSFLKDKADMKQAVASMLVALVALTTEAILLGLAGQYFKTEQAEGTPFTENGASMIKKLGIRCISISIIGTVIESAIVVILGVKDVENYGNLPNVVIGVILIFVSLLLKYGTEIQCRADTVIDVEKECDEQR